MKPMIHSRPRLPVEDYSIALGRAINWLGERYLLAVPAKPSTRPAHTCRRQCPPWMMQPVPFISDRHYVHTLRRRVDQRSHEERGPFRSVLSES
jgi:hypothetical protein